MSSNTTFGHHKICISCKRVEPTSGQSQCLTCRRNTNRKSRKRKKLEVEKKIEREREEASEVIRLSEQLKRIRESMEKIAIEINKIKINS